MGHEEENEARSTKEIQDEERSSKEIHVEERAQKKFAKKKGAQKKFKKRQGPSLKKFQKKQCVKITFKLFLDDYPEDTTWKITSSDKNVLMAGGDYKYKKRHFIMKCVEPGCYTFEIKDSFGDGLALG